MARIYTKLLIFWGFIFIVSLSYTFTGLSLIRSAGNGSSAGLEKPSNETDHLEKPEQDSLGLGMTIAIVTAVASGGGFLTTTYFAIRDDRRQSALQQLQITSLKKEIEYKEMEIARLRREREQQQPLA